MSIIKYILMAGLMISFLRIDVVSQELRQRRAASPSTRDKQAAESSLTGLYRIDVARSDTLYSVVADASSNLPLREQQRFFIDLAVRLTPPDQFSIEQRGRSISIASSRAPRISFEADGVVHTERSAEGRPIYTRATMSGGQLVVNTNGGGDDKFSVTFEAIDNGQGLRVIRRIYAKELNEPIVIRSIYNKVSEVAQWAIYGEPEDAPSGKPTVAAASNKSESVGAGRNGLANLRTEFEKWVAATNARDIRTYLSFYMPRLKAFYLARNVPRDVVRRERALAFESADLIEVHAVGPETIFVDEGRIAIMRFRKQYTTKKGAQNHRGEVVQELRWQRTDRGWKIFSERDVRVLR